VRDVKNKLPKPIENVCYVLDPGPTCTWEQYLALQNGTAKTQDWVVTWPEGSDGESGSEKDSSAENGSAEDDSAKDDDGTSQVGESVATVLGSRGWAAALVFCVLASM
jgi:hypothetical protein